MRRRGRGACHSWFPFLVSVFWYSSFAAADDSRLPDFARFKPHVDDVEHKTEGSFLSGLPLVGYDTNLGLGLGVGGYYTMDGKRTDGLFAVTPYRHRFFLQAYATTGGFQQHELGYDGIYVGNTPLRVRALVVYQRNTNANYFGLGSSTLAPLSFHGVTHSTYDAQTAAVTQAGAPNYNHYQYDNPFASVTVEHDFWGGRVRTLYGYVAQYDAISTLDGETKLKADCAAHAVVGCTGGWDNLLKAGLALDTRDFEPDPTRGWFIDATGEAGIHQSPSPVESGGYVRFTVAARAYWSPIPKLTNLVLAMRLLYSMQTGQVPFYAADTLALTEADQYGLGGERTLRGYRQDRFIGPIMAVGNAELRWTFVHFKLLKQRFSVQIAPLLDVGRVFDGWGRLQLNDWKISGGAGLRVAWNRSTVIMLDFGASSEDTGIFVDFGMPF